MPWYRPPNAPERFAKNHAVNSETGCWDWTGYKNPSGYGRFRVRSGKILAHRFAYQHFVRPIPSGLVIDHLCRNPGCVNPSHMEPVTQRENQMRGLRNQHAGKTHCQEGHLYDAENTYFTNGNGRACRKCHSRWSADYRRRKEPQ